MKPILCILAGGRSSRFGSPKLWLRVEGKPIITWLSHRLGTVCGQRWLSVAPGAELPPGAGGFDRIIADPVCFAGPLQAMVNVLAHAPPQAVVIFAGGDMPLIEDVHVKNLVQVLRSNRNNVGIMSRWTRGDRAGFVEPLPCVWRARTGAKLIRTAMMRGLRGPSQLAKWQRVRCVAIDSPSGMQAFGNINRREDLSAMSNVKVVE